jgi:hypothetical protein
MIALLSFTTLAVATLFALAVGTAIHWVMLKITFGFLILRGPAR